VQLVNPLGVKSYRSELSIVKRYAQGSVVIFRKRITKILSFLMRTGGDSTIIYGPGRSSGKATLPTIQHIPMDGYEITWFEIYHPNNARHPQLIGRRSCS
jgi:hypothetical protein